MVYRLLSVAALMLISFVTVAQDELQDQTLLMTFIPNIQFAPTYVAMSGGYFEDNGFNVEVEYLNEPDVVDLVATDRNQFGIVSGEQVILAAAQERPIVYVYEWFQEYPVGVVYSSDIDVESVLDLTGLRVGIPGRFGASYSGFTTLLESAEMVEADVQLEEIGFAAPEIFCVGAVDASVIYVNNEPLQIRNRAQNDDCGDVQDVDVLPIADVVDLVSNGLITNQTTLDNNPELVQAFVDAYHAGLRDTLQNPVRAYLISASFIENLPLSDDLQAAMEALADEQDEFLQSDYDADALLARYTVMYDALSADFSSEDLLQFEVLLASLPLWEGEQLGFSTLESWENMQDALLALGVLAAAVDLDAIFTNDFVPESD